MLCVTLAYVLSFGLTDRVNQLICKHTNLNDAALYKEVLLIVTQLTPRYSQE